MDWTSAFGVFLFSFFSFFFWHAFARFAATVHGYCSCTVQRTVAAKFDFSIFFSQSVHIVHCLWTHKFHFSKTFSLKMSLTVLFTHLKIILLQYFSVFSFSFQFSAVSKRILNVSYRITRRCQLSYKILALMQC